MTQKILIIGSVGEGKSALLLQAMKEKYGDDIVLVTPEEAKEQGLKPEDFGNIPSYKITAPPIMEQQMILSTPLSGKESRRKRREQERKDNKNQL
jgi:predicted ATP-dependent serine protease